MTPYTLCYWVKNTDNQWEQVVGRFYAESLDEAKTKAVLPKNSFLYNVTLYGDAATPCKPPKKKNTNAWQPKRYSK